MELDEIKYNYAVELTKFFLEKYRDREIDSLDAVVRNVKRFNIAVMEMSYTYDESVWFPTMPETIRDLVEFKVQLSGSMGYLPFRLFVSKGYDQEPIFAVNGFWDWGSLKQKENSSI